MISDSNHQEKIMRVVKPINPINKEPPVDPFLLERMKIAVDAIRRGEETFTLEEVATKLRNLIKEKSNNANISNNNKQNSRERSS